MSSAGDQELDVLIAEITKNADGDSAAMAAFHQAIAGSLKVPTFGIALGERVQIEAVEFEHLRRGITLKLRKDGRPYTSSLLDVRIPGKSKGAKLVAAFQRWVGDEQLAVVAAAAAASEGETLEVEQHLMGVEFEHKARGMPTLGEGATPSRSPCCPVGGIVACEHPTRPQG